MARPVTLITGASAGLGAEFARQCAARGEALALVARRRDRLEALAAELGGDVHIFAADLAQAGRRRSLIAELEAEGLTVDTLINNAGFGLAGKFADRPLERQREMIDLNVRTLTELCHLVLPGMRAARQGRDSQRRLDRRLPAGAEHGGLLCDQGLSSSPSPRRCTTS